MKHFSKKLLTFLVIFAISFTAVFATAFAQSLFTGGLGGPGIPGQIITGQSVFNLIKNLSCYFLKFGMIAAVIAIVVYGIMFMKSRGNPQEFGGAKKSLAWGLVGVLVIFGVFTIIFSIADLLGVSYPILRIMQCS